jgi:hypothetical protein
VIPKNPVLDLAAGALIAVCVYRIARMFVRREAFVRDGWLKWMWEPKDLNRWMYVYGLAIHTLMVGLCVFIIYADFKGWMR